MCYVPALEVGGAQQIAAVADAVTLDQSHGHVQ